MFGLFSRIFPINQIQGKMQNAISRFFRENNFKQVAWNRFTNFSRKTEKEICKITQFHEFLHVKSKSLENHVLVFKNKVHEGIL